MGIESGEPKNARTIETLPAVKENLVALGEKELLIAHQTHDRNAQQITLESEYFSHSGLVGTALIKNPESIIETAKEMMRPGAEQEYGVIHKGSNAIVIMTFAKELADKLVKDGEMSKVSLHGIDDYLVDLSSEGVLKTWGMPNRCVYGYIQDGNLVLNPNYTGKIKNE